MPTALALVAALTLLLAGPAAATGGGDAQPADIGFPIVLLVLAVVAVVFALVWRAVSRRRQGSD
jgi:membrane protein implicated in regulation of membrane protease activity